MKCFLKKVRYQMISEEERKAIEYYQDKEVGFTLENFDFAEFKKTLGITEEDSFENHQIRFKTLLNLIETQNKMIELMAEFMNRRSWKEHQVKDEVCCCCKFEFGSDECEQCIIEYFRNKVKESE